jgi:hypothetical protein
MSLRHVAVQIIGGFLKAASDSPLCRAQLARILSEEKAQALTTIKSSGEPTKTVDEYIAGFVDSVKVRIDDVCEPQESEKLAVVLQQVSTIE